VQHYRVIDGIAKAENKTTLLKIDCSSSLFVPLLARYTACSTLLSIQLIVSTVVSHLLDTTLLMLSLIEATLVSAQRDFTFVLYTSAAG